MGGTGARLVPAASHLYPMNPYNITIIIVMIAC